MSLQRLKIDGFGTLELNNVAFRRTGSIEAQTPLANGEGLAGFKEGFEAENGMILAVDRVANEISRPGDKNLPLALHYSSERMYDGRYNAYKHFSLRSDLGEFYPRLGYLVTGDTFTENCICYDTEDFEDDDALIEALGELNGVPAVEADVEAGIEGSEAVPATPLFATESPLGAIQIVKALPDTARIKMLVIKNTTVPAGTIGLKFQVL